MKSVISQVATASSPMKLNNSNPSKRTSNGDLNQFLDTPIRACLRGGLLASKPSWKASQFFTDAVLVPKSNGQSSKLYMGGSTGIWPERRKFLLIMVTFKPSSDIILFTWQLLNSYVVIQCNLCRFCCIQQGNFGCWVLRFPWGKGTVDPCRADQVWKGN